MIFMGYGKGWADIAAAEAFNTVFHHRNNHLMGIFIKAKAIRWAHIKTELTAPAGLFMDSHFKHGSLLSEFSYVTHPVA